MKNCNFTLPKPLIIEKIKGRRIIRRYRIYPNLSRFESLCEKCPHKIRQNQKFLCSKGVPDFNLRYYGIDGPYTQVGKLPADLRPSHSAYRVAVEFLECQGRTRGNRERSLRFTSSMTGGKSPCLPVTKQPELDRVSESIKMDLELVSS